jgi:hypothetical protein
MNESQFTGKLLRALRSHPALREAVIFKFNATGGSLQRGIPDFSITMGTYTCWAEVKVGENNPTKIQAYFLKKLGEGAILIRSTKRISLVNDNEYFEFDELVECIARRVVNRVGA